jgi:isochorismate hydrolase
LNPLDPASHPFHFAIEENPMPLTTLDVTLALDAMTDIREESHKYSICNVFPRLGETGSTQEIISLLGTRSAAS